MNEHSTPGPDLTRRVVLRGAAVTGLALPVLTACGSGAETSPGAGEGTTGSPSGEGGSGSGGATTVPASDVPVGGGTILGEEKVVVTQPSEGEYKAFSAICTHQGCPVQTVQDGTINCPCHGSKFSVEDGSVVSGPASSSLETVPVQVQGGQLRVG